MDSSIDTISSIVRINARFPPTISKKNDKIYLKLLINLTSEFNENAEDLIFAYKFEVKLIFLSAQNLSVIKVSSTPYSYILYIDITNNKPPNDDYKLHIYPSPENIMNRSRVLILDLITESLILDSNYNITSDIKLYNHRNIVNIDKQLTPVSVLIKEEYGKSIGHHIYDASIILLRYFSTLNLPVYSPLDTTDNTHSNVLVELGAGCGVAGIALSKHFKHTILTDLPSQMDIIQENIQLNNSNLLPYKGGEQTCQAVVLDWSQADETLNIKSGLGHEPNHNNSKDNDNIVIDVIIASDVLYDRDAAEQCIACIKRLYTINHTKVYISQKMRNETSKNRFQLKDYFGISVVQVYEEASCVVWSLSFT